MFFALNTCVTVLLWAYMFAVQLGVLNLLIAIMTGAPSWGSKSPLEVQPLTCSV